MKIVKTVIVMVAIALVAFLVTTVFLPRDYKLDRSIEISAAPELIFPFLVEMEKWHWWNPMRELDPAMEITNGAIVTGIGAGYIWSGTVAGSGSLEIVGIEANREVTYRIIFAEQPDNPAYSTIQLTRAGNRTLVLWTISGTVNDDFFGKWMSLLMESALGPIYDDGLRKLKLLAEASGRMNEATPE